MDSWASRFYGIEETLEGLEGTDIGILDRFDRLEVALEELLQRTQPSSTEEMSLGSPVMQSQAESYASPVQTPEEMALLRDSIVILEKELDKSRQAEAKNQEEAVGYQQLYHQLEMELKDLKDHGQQMKLKQINVISDLLISLSKAERQEARIKIKQESLRLGNIGYVRVGTILSEVWEDGQVIMDINAHLKSLSEAKEAIDRRQKSVKKKQCEKGDGDVSDAGISEEDFLLQNEICVSRLADLKSEEDKLLRERDCYEFEKAKFIRELKRLRDEDGSCFNNFQVFKNRYALLNLLKKGGFSEIYKAYDLVENRYVACKIQSPNTQLSEEIKKYYIHHVIRKCNIHKTLVHRHIVPFLNSFNIDQNIFCTILEYCSGKDLDAILKEKHFLPEKEARIIIFQIFQSLAYLNQRDQKIIYFNLKPRNVLFDELGFAKLTNFYLSKIIEDGSQGIEFTFQGEGTYWYLPPECFEQSKTTIISSKVDVWSAGITLYQMLFGRCPFGHGQSQATILLENTILNAHQVDFPFKPAVSDEAKGFICRCLIYNQADRPDVLTAAQDPFLFF